MSKRGEFDASRSGNFVESVLLERNTDSTRSLIEMAAGVGAMFENIREIVDHAFTDPRHIHSTQIPEMAVGTYSSSGFVDITSNGWSRVFFRVRGVACDIPLESYTVIEGQSHMNPLGAVFKLFTQTQTPYIHTEREVIVNVVSAIDSPFQGTSGSAVLHGRGSIALNGSPDVADYSIVPRLMDRVVSFSIIGPVRIRPFGSSVSLTAFLGGSLSGFYNGGTAPDGLSTYDTQANFNALSGTNIGFSLPVCTNPGLQTTKLLTPFALFPQTNQVQLQAQLIGLRPQDSPTAEKWVDLT